MQKSSSQIYTVGHQTLDVKQSRFQTYVIGKEDASRISMFRRGRIDRVYDPVLQVEPHEEPIRRDPVKVGTGEDKAEMAAKYHTTVGKFQADMESMKDLEAKRRRLKKELHLLDSSLGDKKTRDFCFMDPKKVAPDTIIPPTSTFAAAHKQVQERQAQQRQELWEQQQLPHANLHTLAPVPAHRPMKAYGDADRSTQKSSYECFVNTEKQQRMAEAATAGAGGGTASPATSMLSLSGGSTMGRTAPPFESNKNSFNDRVLAHNELLQPKRQARSTLLLSGLGFKGHCTEHAMVIIRILQSKNI